MAGLSKENLERARQTIALYPQARSAMLPLLHIVQEQEGYLTEEGMAQVADLLDLSPAEVYGTATFYDMLFTHPVGTYLLSVCTNIACLLNGGYELLEHAEKRLGVKAGGTTADGRFTLEEVECIGLCGNAPCLTANWRFFGDLTAESFDTLVDDLGAGRLSETVPRHGTLCRVRRSVGLTAAGPKGEQAKPPPEEAAAPASEAPQSVAPGTHDQPPSREGAKKAAKQASEVPKTGDTASDQGSGRRK
ncbi:MAG: NADH-quinone oxidoreductase subunit NuoE [Actinobacteria bacterium]|nr:NADH-quinone oxidoreductase subunit NuoE [Actinomycetota bacterium]